MKRIYFVTQSQNSRRGTGEEEETYFIKKKNWIQKTIQYQRNLYLVGFEPNQIVNPRVSMYL